ncbi:MAG: metal ABC transporter substrate-binding protein [Gammaproteobacteria bacterium]|nr:metal ABC transporter substrate-binding protein [Gammaproteobacteria bacterium]
MAKFSRILLLAILISPATALAEDKLKVLTTFTVIADMARNVAGEAADVVSLTKPGAEIHNYQPTPKDIVRARDADLVLWNGLNLELWFEKFLVRLKNVPSIILTEGIEPMGIQQGPYTGKPNPHAWMSASDALVYVDNIEKALSVTDPNNALAYQQNAKRYKEAIRAAVDPLRQQLDSIPPENRWLVTSEGAFSYLARDFGLNELYLWPINADEQGTPKQVKKVIDQVREHNIKAVFSESTVSNKSAKQVARETDAHYGGVLYVDSLSDSDGPVPTYLDLLRVTVETVVTGLTR